MRINKQVKEYLQEYMDARTEIDEETNCHLWTKGTGWDRYGQVPLKWMRQDVKDYIEQTFGNRYYIQAHRLNYILSGQPLTKDKPLVLHKCSNRNCCNPKHLFNGDNKDNANCLDVQQKKIGQPMVHHSKRLIKTIKKEILKGASFRSLSRIYGVSLGHISQHYAKQLIEDGHILTQKKEK